jgi:hypothetical protein
MSADLDLNPVVAPKKQPMSYLLVALLVGLSAATVRSSPLNVIVAADMNAAGRKIQRPTPDHPAYYIGVFRGYTDKGKQWGNGDPERASVPSNETVQRLLTQTLAAQGYLSAIVDAPVDTKTSPANARRQMMRGAPSLLLNIQWGYLSNMTFRPSTRYQSMTNGAGGVLVTRHDEESDPDPTPEQIELIGAQKNLNPGSYRDARLTRYYIIVDAFDYAAYVQTKKPVLLWRIRLSVPANHNSLAGTLPALLAAGGPSFGQDVKLPMNVTVDVLPSGKVTIGKTIVIGDKP